MSSLLNGISYCIATGLYSGLTPKLPGTAGSLACLIIFLVLNKLCSELASADLCLASAIITIAGCLAVAQQLKLHPANHDPQHIVIDEWAGLSLAFCVLTPTADSFLWQAILLFVLFRFFDIVKPWPVSAMEKLPGAAGVMLDDLLAGAMAAAVFSLILAAGGSV